MVRDGSFFGAAAVLCCGGGRKLPFYESGADNERDIVQVDDLEDEIEFGLGGVGLVSVRL